MGSKPSHMVDLLFIIALFCVFAASSLVVVMIGANSYRQTTQKAEENYAGRTALSYVTQKVRQNDQSGGVGLDSLKGVPALTLSREIDGHSYITYIYHHEGQLKELFVDRETEAMPQDGQTIMEIQDLAIERVESSLLRLSATEQDGKRQEVFMRIRSAS